ncbi:uncharacterized protein involved in type VI secretion and phage assembly [Variovorax boronicumulans]|uniref:hypothetical protein n=1 Tax=Variovorax boronicumulans TaxID=436515 RepID=UPI00247613A7|nr:hypothetical protein [Variovorax boronicumulans]MDH6169539.1 uncharacterized protein involved in type VI secretion and phage assembly [Variovorax boronicumulans]
MPQTLSVISTAIPTSLGLPALVPVRLAGREGVNGLFEYEIILRTPNALNLGASGAADYNLDGFIGHAVTCVSGLDGEYSAGSIPKETAGKYTNHAAIHGYAPADSKAPEKLNGEACGTKEMAADKGGNSVSRR